MNMFRSHPLKKDAQHLMKQHYPLLPIIISPARLSQISQKLKTIRFMISPEARIQSVNAVINQKLFKVFKMEGVSVFLFPKYGKQHKILNPGLTIAQLSLNQNIKPNGWIELLYHDQQTF